MKINNTKAFSFVEVMVAVLIFGLLSLGIFSMFSQARTGTMQTSASISANSYAASIINYARSLPFDDPFLEAADRKRITTVSPSVTDSSASLFDIDSDVECYLTVQPMLVSNTSDNSYYPYTYKVLRVDVKYKSSGQERTVTQTSMLTGATK